MELKTYFAQDAAGNIISSAIVNVFLQGTTTLATGLTRADGTPLENPFAADGAGRIQFRAPDGYYDVQVSAGPGIIQTLTIQCVDYSGAKADADRAEAAADRAGVSAEQAQNSLNSITGINTNFEQNSREQWSRSLAEAGLTLVSGSFEEGATANSSTDAVWHIAGGQCYTWGGAFPKTVPADSTPTSTGGVNPSAWVSVGDASLRTQLYSSGGTELIGSPHSGTLAQMLPWVTPEQFGAVGDGITDDIAALDACMSYARERGVDIVFSKTYAISRPYVIYMGLRRNPRHIGMGNMAKIIITTTATSGLPVDSYEVTMDVNAAVIVAAITGTGYSQQPQNFRWENIDIDTTVNADYGMYTSKMQSAAIRNFRTYNFKTGIQDNGSWNTLYENIKMSKHSTCGFRKTSGTSTTIRNCYVEQSTVGYHVRSGYSQLEGCACDTSTDVSYWIEGNPVASSSDDTFSIVSCGSENSGKAVIRLTGTVTLSVRNFQAFNWVQQQDPIPEYFLDLQSNSASIALEDIRYLGISAGRIKDTGVNNTITIRNMTTRGDDVRSGDVFPINTRIIELGKSGVRVASGYSKDGILIDFDNLFYTSGARTVPTNFSPLFNKQRIYRTLVTLTRSSGTYARAQVTLPFSFANTDYVVQLTPNLYHTDIATHALIATVGNTDKTVNSFYVNLGSINGSDTWTVVQVDVTVFGLTP